MFCMIHDSANEFMLMYISGEINFNSKLKNAVMFVAKQEAFILCLKSNARKSQAKEMHRILQYQKSNKIFNKHG